MSTVQEMTEGLDLASLADEIVEGKGRWAAVKDRVIEGLANERRNS